MCTSEIKEEFSLILSALQKRALNFLSPQWTSTLKSGGNSWNGSKLMDVPHPRAEEGHLHLLLSINMIKMIVHRPTLGFPGGSEVKASARNAGNLGSIHGLGRSPGERNGNPLQYSSWRIPWTEDPGGLQSTGSQRVGHNWATLLSLFTLLSDPLHPCVTGERSLSHT